MCTFLTGKIFLKNGILFILKSVSTLMKILNVNILIISNFQVLSRPCFYIHFNLRNSLLKILLDPTWHLYCFLSLHLSEAENLLLKRLHGRKVRALSGNKQTVFPFDRTDVDTHSTSFCRWFWSVLITFRLWGIAAKNARTATYFF